MKQDIAQLENTIGYTFEEKSYLQTALTHSSYANEVKRSTTNNERQEFLGDAVLSIIVSDFLFRNFRLPEGDLTKLRASLVCEQSLCEFARSIKLGEYLSLGHGEKQNGGAERDSILADAFEALIAAIYLDNGMDSARAFVIPFVEEMLQGGDEQSFQDYKTLLQEIVQQNPEEVISYQLVEESGPDHDKRFVVELMLNSNVVGRGEGRSKKNAEQEAARQALELFGEK
ncbi:MAG: ribonuclease III [Oscillospiraceae bacterium]